MIEESIFLRKSCPASRKRRAAMNRQGRILVVDDLEKWREQLVETFQRNDFYADSVATAKEALDRLEESYYHLLILDVRLVDADPYNQEGIDLLAELERRGL